MRAATSEDALLRAAVASNPYCPVESLLALAADSVWQVRRAAANLSRDPLIVKLLGGLAHDGHSEVRQGLAANSSCEDAVLRRLAGDEAVVVRAAVASNRAPLPATLRILASDESAVVRKAAAHNGRLPVETQRALAADTDRSVVTTVARWASDPDLLRGMLDG
jgi:hypothetical protein